MKMHNNHQSTQSTTKLFPSVKASQAASPLELEPLQIKSIHPHDENDILPDELEKATPVHYTVDEKLEETEKIPTELQLYRLENLAVPACYFVVGTLQGLVRPLLNVYPLDLGATEAQQTSLAMIVTIPAAFKLVFGFLSDNVPLYGYRRKSYMMLGWWGTSVSTAYLLWNFNLSDVQKHGNDATVQQQQQQSSVSTSTPSLQTLFVVFFLFGCSLWMADVMADSIVAQKARLETAHQRGSLQSSCYAARFLGNMIFAPLSTALYSCTPGPFYIVCLLCFIPFSVMTPLIYYFAEDANIPIPPTSHQCQEIWSTVCQRSVWQPMAFVYGYNLLQVSNAAWRQFLSTVYGFTAANLNALLVVSYVMLYLGTLSYKYCCLHMSWRRIYQSCLLFNAVLSSMQLLLIQGRTFGLPPFVFALGDDAMAELLQGIQFLPLSIMMVLLCPVGSEGVSYSMFTTVW
jgi:hypothetical protein